MLWDSGLDARYMDNNTAVDNKIAELEKTFDLVMMAEMFDESMVLLRDLLCWDMADVVNFKLNARKESKKIELSSQARQALREYLAADYKLYNHFKAQFSNRLKQFGKRRLETELAELRRANEDMKTMCGIQARDNDMVKGVNKLWGQGMVAYTAQNSTDTQCQLFAMSELSLIKHLREVQTENASH